MFEFMGLIGLIFLFGVIFLAAGILILPFYLLFKVLGFALKIGFAGLFVAFFGLLLLPVALLVGAIVFLKLLVIGLPLLIAFALFGWLVGFFRRPEPQTIYVQTVPPSSP